MEHDPLTDFCMVARTFGGETKDVYQLGEGPAVIVITEMPGITPAVADFARRTAAAGYTAVMPQLFGTPGKEQTFGYVLRSLARACVSREFVAFARGRTSPVTTWLRALAVDAHERCGGRGVGVVGMCFTGGFALGMMVEDVVQVPVLGQPSLPLVTPFKSAESKADLGVSPDDLAAAKRRTEDGGVCVIGLRFTDDGFVPADRFETLRREFGDAFIGVEIDSSPGNEFGFDKRSHSVLTREYDDADGHPTREAWDLVLQHFSDRL